MPLRLLRRAAFTLAVGALVFQTSATRAQTTGRSPQSYVGTLSHARVSTTPGGHLIVSTESDGDLRGMLTLDLAPGEDGSLSGTWVLLVAYVQDTTQDGSIALDVPHTEPTDVHAEHREYFKFMRDGSVQGTVSGVTLLTGPDGQTSGISAAQLTVTAGSLKFAGAHGNGSIAVSTLDPSLNSFSFLF
jgi:hypothetical protein